MTRADVIVIGGEGIGAAALLAQAGLKVVLLRAPDETSGFGALSTLDPYLVERLKLARHGLSFLHRDLPRIILGAEHPPPALPRERQDAARALKAVSQADALAWPGLQRRFFRRARALRPWWNAALAFGAPADHLQRRGDRAWLARAQWRGGEALLGRFESESLRDMLLFEALAGGLAPSEPGAALALAWHAGHEMAGRQGALALPRPGTLELALSLAADAAGVESIRVGVARLAIENGRAAGVIFADGERMDARLVLSALSRAQTLALAGLPPPETAPVGAARMLFTLAAPHGLAPARYVLAGSAAHQADAYEAARDGRAMADPPLCFVPLAVRELAVTLRPVPHAADPARLAAAAVKALRPHLPGLTLAGLRMAPRPPLGRVSLSRLAAPARTRIATPLPNLLLCGPDAEPVPAPWGRAAALAAAVARDLLKPRSG